MFQKIKRIIQWVHFLWTQTNEWDEYCNILMILDYQLSRTEKVIKECTWLCNTNKLAKKVSIIRHHIKRYLGYGLDFVEDVIWETEGEDCSDPLQFKPVRQISFKWVYKKNYMFPLQQRLNHEQLKTYHWERIWFLMNKYGRDLWT
jgi:hypothetical protein